MGCSSQILAAIGSNGNTVTGRSTRSRWGERGDVATQRPGEDLATEHVRHLDEHVRRGCQPGASELSSRPLPVGPVVDQRRHDGR